MLNLISRNWWVFLVRGIAALIFGVLALTSTPLTMVMLVLFFGAYAFIDGAFAIISTIAKGIAHEKTPESRPFWMLLEGVAGIVTGIVTFAWPGITAIALLYLIAAWALITGIFEVMAAIRLRKEIRHEWLLGLSGVVSVLFAVALAVRPALGALAVTWMIGVYAVAFGAILIGLAFRVRALASRDQVTTPPGGKRDFAYR